MASKFGILLLDYRENLTRNPLQNQSILFQRSMFRSTRGFLPCQNVLGPTQPQVLPRMETADPKRPPPQKKKRPQPRHMQWCQPYNCIHPIPSHPTNEELFAIRRPSWATSHGDQSSMGCFRRTGSLQVWAIFLPWFWSPYLDILWSQSMENIIFQTVRWH